MFQNVHCATVVTTSEIIHPKELESRNNNQNNKGKTGNHFYTRFTPGLRTMYSFLRSSYTLQEERNLDFLNDELHKYLKIKKLNFN
jgi:hypothetical protein